MVKGLKKLYQRVSELNGTSAQLGYMVPFQLDVVEKISLYAIAYRRY